MSMRKQLTPAQDYLKRVFVALEDGQTNNIAALLLERPATLKSAIAAAFYKSNGFDVKRYINR